MSEEKHSEQRPNHSSGGGASPKEKIWQVGKILLDGYRIMDELGYGGMGRVYLVEREIYKETLLFAIKTMHTSLLENEKRKRMFFQELRTWIDLPDYPHLTACRFFRTIEDRLVIFSEFVDGGTLDQWIRKKKLQRLEMILDIGIQTAWGLQAAHECDVIHQDVKPANILLTKDGIAKLTDFGFSRAFRIPETDEEESEDLDSARISSSGMTVAYCSPEQVRRIKVGRRTDMWSWGVSMLEMFIGKVTWKLGIMAPMVLENYRNHPPPLSGPVMPESVAVILEKCFEEEPHDRWPGMNDISDRLIDIYFRETGREYPRKKPVMQKPDHPVGQDRDRAGKQWDDPLEWIRKAHDHAEMPPPDPDDFVSQSEGSFKARALADLEIFEKAIRIYSNARIEGSCECEKTRASLMTQKALIHEAVGDHKAAIHVLSGLIDHLGSSTADGMCGELIPELAKACVNKANNLVKLSDFQASLELYDTAAELLSNAPPGQEDTEQLVYLAKIYQNRAVVFWNTGKLQDALTSNSNAIELLEPLISGQTGCEISTQLAIVYLNQANTLVYSGHAAGGREYYDKSIRIMEDLYLREHTPEDASHLAVAHLNKSNLLGRLHEHDDAIASVIKAVELLEPLVYLEGRNEHYNKLIVAYMNHSMFLGETGRLEDAITLNNKAIELARRVVFQEGHAELIALIPQLSINQAEQLHKTGSSQEGIALCDSGIEILETLVHEQGVTSLISSLGWGKTLKAMILSELKQYHAARLEVEQAIALLRPEFEDTGRDDLKDILEKSEEILKNLPEKTG